MPLLQTLLSCIDRKCTSVSTGFRWVSGLAVGSPRVSCELGTGVLAGVCAREPERPAWRKRVFSRAVGISGTDRCLPATGGVCWLKGRGGEESVGVTAVITWKVWWLFWHQTFLIRVSTSYNEYKCLQITHKVGPNVNKYIRGQLIENQIIIKLILSTIFPTTFDLLLHSYLGNTKAARFIKKEICSSHEIRPLHGVLVTINSIASFCIIWLQ